MSDILLIYLYKYVFKYLLPELKILKEIFVLIKYIVLYHETCYWLLTENDIAEIPKRGRKELKQIIIDGRKYRYNKDKPISNILQNKLKTIKRTNEWRSYSHKKISLSLGMKKALTKYAIRNKFRVENKQSAFKNYANNLTLVNKHYQGEKGLSMIQYQKTLLLEFLNNNRFF